MKLFNGVNKPVRFDAKEIEREAGFDTGPTSIVFALCDNGKSVNISQHESGDWDISVNGEPHETHDEGEEAVKSFMEIVLEGESDED